MILGQTVLEIYDCLKCVTNDDGGDTGHHIRAKRRNKTPYDELPKTGKRSTICINGELIGTYGRAIERVYPDHHDSITPQIVGSKRFENKRAPLLDQRTPVANPNWPS